MQTNDLPRIGVLSADPAAVTQFLRRVQALGRYVCADAACSACYGSLLYALNKLEADYGRLTFDDTICIGQNYRGKTGSLGIGSCTQGFTCSLKGCPPSAAEIYDFLLAHMTAR